MVTCIEQLTGLTYVRIRLAFVALNKMSSLEACLKGGEGAAPPTRGPGTATQENPPVLHHVAEEWQPVTCDNDARYSGKGWKEPTPLYEPVWFCCG